MKYSYTAKKRIRKSFGKLGDVLPIPNLIELQVLSYNKFLGKNSKGQIDFSNSGLDEVFKSVFPIKKRSVMGSKIRAAEFSLKLGRAVVLA